MYFLFLRICRQLENWRLIQRMYGLVMGVCYFFLVLQYCNRDKDRMRQRDFDLVLRGQGGFWKIVFKLNKFFILKQICIVRYFVSMFFSQFIEECCFFIILLVCCFGLNIYSVLCRKNGLECVGVQILIQVRKGFLVLVGLGYNYKR